MLISKIKSKVASNQPPISVNEFGKALLRIWQPTATPSNGPHKLGLAVSGGVDSMALAHLCASLQFVERNRVPIQLQAFIVDHGARDGSADEAKQVRAALRQMTLSSEILTLQWPDEKQIRPEPKIPTDFETQARKLRYRALGEACVRHGIRTLLLGHHADDQVETILMRLARSHRNGLSGMRAVMNIPECTGMYGASQSGGPLLHTKQTTRSLHQYEVSRLLPGRKPTIEGVESGGVKVLRPLLGFSKQQLVATCEEAGVRWFEDATNADKTLTTRNAVRSVTGDRRPRALSDARLLQVLRTTEEREAASEECAKRALSKCRIRCLDLRSGVLWISIPPDVFSDVSAAPAKLKDALRLLRHIASLVSPAENIDLGSLLSIAPLVLPHAFQVGRTDDAGQATSSFTAVEVQFNPGAKASTGAFSKHSIDRVWLLHRRPFPSNLVAPTIQVPGVDMDKYGFTSGIGGSDGTVWHLFDGRFWMGTRNRGATKVTIRLLRESDVTYIYGQLSPQQRAALKARLRVAAPEKARYTLPAMADEDDNVFALPTLGFSFDERVPESFGWRCRYKNIDLSAFGKVPPPIIR